MNIEKLSNLCSDISTEWEDVQISYKNKFQKEKLITIPLIFTGSNGVYVFIEQKHKPDTQLIYNELEKIFHLRNDGLYLFLVAEDNNGDEADETELPALAYDSANKTFIELLDIYDAFDAFYYNHYIPQAELSFYTFNSFEDYFNVQEVETERMEDDEDSFKYVKPIISSEKVNFIEEKLVEILSSGTKKGNYTYYSDGTITVKKIAKDLDSWKKPWSSYAIPKTFDFPCSDEAGEKTFLRTLFGGWFGLHKFKERKILQGLLYLISCGGCCMCYIIDVIAVMTGNYFTTNNHYFRDDYGRVERKQAKVYTRPIKNKKIFLLFPIMIVLSFCLLKFVYLPIYTNGSIAVSEFITDIISNSAKQFNIN